MKDARSKLVVLATVAVFCTFHCRASAAADAGTPPPERIAEARPHFERGHALYGEGKHAEARAEIEQAYALAPNYRLLYELALCSDGMGDRAAAIRYLQRYLTEGGAEIAPARRKEAEELMTRLRAHVAVVTLRANVPGEAAVVVDEQPMGDLADGPLVLLPGARKIWVTKAGYYPATQLVLVKDGDVIEVKFDLKELPRVAAQPRTPWWRHRYAVPAAIASVAVLLLIGTLLRRRRAAGANLVHLNPYVSDKDVEAPPVTPAQTNVITLDGAPSKDPIPVRLLAAVASDVGRVKPSNEDSHLVDAEKGLFVVADGIGGYAGGGVASATAVEVIKAYFKGKREVGALTHLAPHAAQLASSVFLANATIRQRQVANPNIADMGSTCVAAHFKADTGELAIAHVGDSRVYRFRGGRLEQLTTDHTMAELGVTGRRAQHLSRALGSEAAPKIDVLLTHAAPDDLYLLCCDGLNKMLDDASLAKLLAAAASPEAAVTGLVASANEQGGLDNITALVVRVAKR